MQFLLIFAIVIAILTVVFTVQNTALITVSFLAWKFQGSLALILFIVLGLGMIISLLVSMPASIKKSRLLIHYKKRVQELEKNGIAVNKDLEPRRDSYPVL